MRGEGAAHGGAAAPRGLDGGGVVAVLFGAVVSLFFFLSSPPPLLPPRGVLRRHRLLHHLRHLVSEHPEPVVELRAVRGDVERVGRVAGRVGEQRERLEPGGEVEDADVESQGG